MPEVWEKQPEESPKSYKAFLIYRNLETGRSIDAAYRLSLKEPQESRKRASGRWQDWAQQNQWVARAQAYDEHLESIKESAKEAEIQRIMAEGYAQMHERVKELNIVAGKIRKWVDEEEKVWIEKREEIQTENATIVKTELKFNQALFQEFRGFLDDLAKETGGRVRKTETSLKTLPKQYIGLDELTNAADDDEE